MNTLSKTYFQAINKSETLAAGLKEAWSLEMLDNQ
jgi:hypothetical protein